MVDMSTVITISVGVLLRLIVPVGITAVVIVGLRWLDSRWQADANKSGFVPVNAVSNPGCWKINNCPPENLAGCKAYQHPDVPCWQVFRDSSGQLQESCLSCQVFKEAPLPVAS